MSQTVLRIALLVVFVNALHGCCTFGPCLADIRRPDPAIGAVPLPQPALSTISVPVSLQGIDLKREVNTLIPAVDHHNAREDWRDLGSNFFLRYNAWRGDVTVTAAGSRLTASTRLYAWAEVRKNVWIHIGECGSSDGPRRADVSVTLDAAWGSDWSVDPVVTIPAPSFLDDCRVTALGANVTQLAIKPYVTDHLGEWRIKMHDAIKNATNVKPQAQAAWTQLAAPIQLQGGWNLALNPEAISFAPPRFSSNSMDGGFTITAKPRLYLGPAANIDPTPLPALTSAPVDEELIINGQIVVPFARATDAVKAALQLPYQTGGSGQRIRITDLQLYGAANNLVVLKLVLEEPASGSIYLVGRPVYKGEALQIEDLDFSLETRNVLAKLADWLLHSPVKDTLSAAVNAQVGLKSKDELELARVSLQALANKPLSDNARLVVRIEDIGLVGNPTVAADALVLPLRMRAKAALEVRKQ